MKTRAILALTAVAGLAGMANAQAPQTNGASLIYDLSATVVGGNGTFPLEPGESALIKFNVTMTGQNTTASYTPPSPAPGSGTIRGIGSGFIDFVGTANSGGNAQGTWNTDFVNPGFGPIADGWDLVGPGAWGTPQNSGANLINIQFGQFPLNAAAIVTANPVNLMFQALWTPTSYAARTVTWGMAPSLASQGHASSVMFKTSTTGVAGVNCLDAFNGTSFAVIPAPSSLALLGLGGLLAGRRRR
jgi:hypothetical protein